MMTGWTIGTDGWLWMGIWVLVLAVLVALLVWTPRRRSARGEPLDVLRGRLAHGEISTEEFERARSLLEPTGTTENSSMSHSIDHEARP